MSKCVFVKPEKKDACGEEASFVVYWPGEEGGSSTMCRACSLQAAQLAQSHGSNVRIERRGT